VPEPSSRHPSLARRALPALTLAGAGGLLLLELDHPTPLRTTAAPPASSSTSGAAGAPASPNQSAAAGDEVAPGTVPSTVPPAPGQASDASGSCDKDETGPAVQTRFGAVQVEALVSADGKVCNVQAIQSPGGERRSIAINSYALPILHDRAVQSGAGFDAVTGATVTSDGYRASLQAILDGG
jgi:uncharacterized protein with FMN-binding domain